ncbi:MAG: GGDEF domain-containing protein [Candidatus Omnitrophota bacterium]
MTQPQVINQKDGLTGFHTKQGMYEYLSTKMQSVYSRAARLSVIILDLDHFKGINDSFGHLVGDDALRHFCMAINQALRGRHFVARYGGDEFVIAVEDVPDGRESLEIAKRIKHYLRKERFYTPKGHIRLKTSIGIARFPEDAKTPRGLLEIADQAMYYAKTHGRDRVITSRYLKFSVKDKFLSFIKIGVVLGIIILAFSAYRTTKSFRGVVGYFQNISQCVTFSMHEKRENYNYTTVHLRDGKKLEGWVLKEDDDNMVLTMSKPKLYFNPLRLAVAVEPITIPKEKIASSINVKRE